MLKCSEQERKQRLIENSKCVVCPQCKKNHDFDDLKGDRPGLLTCPDCWFTATIPKSQWYAWFEEYQPALPGMWNECRKAEAVQDVNPQGTAVLPGGGQ